MIATVPLGQQSVLTSRQRLPAWLKRSLPSRSAEKTHAVLDKYRLNTVCESALCPNRSECYAHGTATFMILGNVCTRRCGFCAIETGRPFEIDADEPARVASAAREMGLDYVVVTSVARDELVDEGAGQFAKTICALKQEIPAVRVEVLTPDFHASRGLIAQVVEADPDVYNHNLETVARLQRRVRPQATYARSLQVLETVKTLDPQRVTKSGLMLGLGETLDEVYQAALDLRLVGCNILTLGQYLKPAEGHCDVAAYIEPRVFEILARDLKGLGFQEVFAGPYVRSSYHASETFFAAQGLEKRLDRGQWTCH